ncbi:MAG: hypothetical protein K2J08_09870 [Ruminococcus sp.]|nr:hypothetical protein [Ruminococcus sp.]
MKNKGIIIELTALLDVILIMLFWLMMTNQQNTDSLRRETENRVATAEKQVAEAEESAQNSEKLAENAVAEAEKLRAEIEEIRLETEKDIAEAWKKSASINDTATANQLALENFEKGRLITISLEYGKTAGVNISDNNEILGNADEIAEDNIAEILEISLKKAGLSPDDTVLCAMIYDGSHALYRDVKAMRSAVGEVKKSYPNLYCTYINTKDKEKNNE